MRVTWRGNLLGSFPEAHYALSVVHAAHLSGLQRAAAKTLPLPIRSSAGSVPLLMPCVPANMIASARASLAASGLWQRHHLPPTPPSLGATVPVEYSMMPARRSMILRSTGAARPLCKPPAPRLHWWTPKPRFPEKSHNRLSCPPPPAAFRSPPPHLPTRTVVSV